MILAINICITCRIASLYRQRLTLMADSTLDQTQAGDHARTGAQNHTTKLLLLVSTVFIILNLPSHALRINTLVKSSFMTSNLQADPRASMWLQLTQYLYYANFSINIFLYSLCGKTFRRALFNAVYNTCCCPKRKLPRRCGTMSWVTSGLGSQSRPTQEMNNGPIALGGATQEDPAGKTNLCSNKENIQLIPFQSKQVKIMPNFNEL